MTGQAVAAAYAVLGAVTVGALGGLLAVARRWQSERRKRPASPSVLFGGRQRSRR